MEEKENKKKRKLVVLVNPSAGNESYINYLSMKFDVTVVDAKEYNNESLDLILFTGGEDVNPKYYNQETGRYTAINIERDKFERDYMFDRFPNVPKLGICRGSQFVTVMSGGKLVQHVNGHAIGKLHELSFKKPYFGGVFNITSTHHQMMFPYNLKEEDYSIVATSKYFLSNTYLNGNNNETELPKGFEECEIVFYPKYNALGIQGHPEMPNCPADTKDFCLLLIQKILKLY